MGTANNSTMPSSTLSQQGVYGGVMIEPRLYERFYTYDDQPVRAIHADTMHSTVNATTDSTLAYTTYASSLDLSATASNTTEMTDSHIRLQRNTMYLAGLTIVSSAFVALLWLSLVKSYARTMLYVALMADIVVSVLLALFVLLNGSIIGAVLLFAFAALKALWVYWVRSRIEFAALLLTHAVHCIQQWPATILAAMLSIVVQVLWAVGWAFCTVGFYYAATRVSPGQQQCERVYTEDGWENQCTMQQDNTVTQTMQYSLCSLFSAKKRCQLLTLPYSSTLPCCFALGCRCRTL